MTQLLQNAAYGTALILAAAALRRVLKDRLIPGARLALWVVCLFRLLTPVPLESALSLWGLSRLFQPRQTPAVPAPAPAPAAGAPQLYTPAQTGPSPAAPAIPWETVLFAVWLVVGVVLAVRYVLSWTRTRRAVACAIPVERSDPRYASLPKCARLREGPMEGAPLTFGVVRPTVVLPPALEGEALDCVLAHEGVHASRRDNLWHYVMAIALVTHWWNPAVWLMARLLRRDIELSCDRAALKKLGADRRAEYANTLVSLATQGDGPAFCQTFGRKTAEERILSVMKFKKTSVIGVVLSLALVLAVTVAFASEPKTSTDTVVYHGQTYNRADLSQETLDWLDWYLALPEEEQLAISMVPPELIAGLTPDVYDAMPAASEDQPNYVDPDSAIDPSLREALEAATNDHIQAMVKDASEKDKTVDDCDVRLPTFDENGNYVPADGGTVGSTRYSLCLDEDCGVTGSHVHLNGGVIKVDYQNPYTGSTQPPSTIRVPSCGVEGCTETRYHQHSGGYCFLLSDPCPVEGCTIKGSHEHNGAMYSCNGAGHDSGVCDGSCLVYSQPMQTATNAAPPQSSSTSGHHSESHSSGSHHSGGHH